MDMQGEQENNTLNIQPSWQESEPHQQHVQAPVVSAPVDPATPAQQLKAAMHLASTMPPSKIRKNLVGLVNLAPQIEDVLYEKIDLPLEIDDSDTNLPFLKTEFNRDGDSFRSPHSNTYNPPAQGGYTPQGIYRQLEQLGNILFAEYLKLYYGGNAIGSFYVIEGDNANKFSCGYFVKKTLDENTGFGGSWDSFNVVDIDLSGQEAIFNLTTTIMIQMVIKNNKQGEVDTTGFLKQQKSEKRKINKESIDECLVVVGEMIEDLETVMRQYLDGVYISKTKEIIFSTRLEYTVEYQNQRRSLAAGLKQIHLKG